VAVDQDGALVNVVETGNHVGGSGLARAARPDQGDQLARLAAEADLAERLGAILADVAEADVAELDLTIHVLGAQHQRSGLVLDVMGHVEVVEDPVEEGEGAGDLDLYLEHLPDGEEQPALQGGEAHQGADRDGANQRHTDRPAVVAEEEVAGEEVDQRRRDREEGPDQGHEASADHLLPDEEPGQPAVLALKSRG